MRELERTLGAVCRAVAIKVSTIYRHTVLLIDLLCRLSRGKFWKTLMNKHWRKY